MGSSVVKSDITSILDYKMPMDIIEGFGDFLRAGYNGQKPEERKRVKDERNQPQQTIKSRQNANSGTSSEDGKKLYEIQTAHENLEQIEESADESRQKLNRSVFSEQESSMKDSKSEQIETNKRNRMHKNQTEHDELLGAKKNL